MSAAKYSENRHALKRGADCSGRAIKPIAWAVQVNPAILLLAKNFPYGTSRLGEFPLGGILAKIRAFPYPKRALFSLRPIPT